MPAATANGYPFVNPDDAVHDYPVTSKALADKLEATRHATGTVTLPGGSLVQLPNKPVQYADLSVTFPSAFPTAPRVVASLLMDPTTSAINGWVAVKSVTPTGASLRVLTFDNNLQHTIVWVAVAG